MHDCELVLNIETTCNIILQGKLFQFPNVPSGENVTNKSFLESGNDGYPKTEVFTETNSSCVALTN